MQDSRSVQTHPAHVVSLGGLLQGASANFRMAVLEALTVEGFELNESLPNLQQAREILDAIDWLESRGYGSHWRHFEDLLMNADQEGILVDLGLEGMIP